MLMGVVNLSAADRKAAAETPLNADGEKLLAKYSEMLKTLQAEIEKALPAINEQQKVASQKAREATKAAEAEANAAQQPLGKIQAAKGLVDHAKGKWIGGAEKGIAQAEAALKKATTEAEREAAKKDLARWQADKEAGIKALKERQEALDKAKIDEPRLIQASQAAQAALAQAQTNELMAAQVILTKVEPFLSSDKLDAKLVKCAVLANATPRGLAEFAQQSKEQEALVEKLLGDDGLMNLMIEAGGPRGGKYGQAMQIYTDIQKASSRATKGILHRLALGTALQHALPVGQRNAVANTNAPTVVDPVKRYLHYEKAYLDGELDPAFEDMTAWECRMIVNSDAPDHVLAWGREMLRNYRPDHIFNPDYGWRYSGIVRTDVAYRSSQLLRDSDSLEFFQNVLKEGGVCGRRGFFGRFIVKSFGLPTWGVAQHKHCALGRWTPSGWVVNLGANWAASWSDDPNDRGRRGSDFILETQARKYPQNYLKVLRAQWVGDALGEQKCDSTKEDSGGWWNVLALFEKKAIVAEAKPVQLSALGQELGEANESAATKAMAVEQAPITDADKKIVVAPDGAITIPAVAHSKPTGNFVAMKSFSGGLQLHCTGGFKAEYAFEAPCVGKYALAARVVTVQEVQKFLVLANDAKEPVEIAVPYTVGLWQQTRPVDLSLVDGTNVLHFTLQDGSRGMTIKDFTLTPVK
jgi:hypothetical protein